MTETGEWNDPLRIATFSNMVTIFFLLSPFLRSYFVFCDVHPLPRSYLCTAPSLTPLRPGPYTCRAGPVPTAAYLYTRATFDSTILFHRRANFCSNVLRPPICKLRGKGLWINMLQIRIDCDFSTVSMMRICIQKQNYKLPLFFYDLWLNWFWTINLRNISAMISNILWLLYLTYSDDTFIENGIRNGIAELWTVQT